MSETRSSAEREALQKELAALEATQGRLGSNLEKVENIRDVFAHTSDALFGHQAEPQETTAAETFDAPAFGEQSAPEPPAAI